MRPLTFFAKRRNPDAREATRYALRGLGMLAVTAILGPPVGALLVLGRLSLALASSAALAVMVAAMVYLGIVAGPEGWIAGASGLLLR